MNVPLSRPFPGQRILDWINLNFQTLSPLRIIEGSGIRLEWGLGYVIIHSRDSVVDDPKQSFDVIDYSGPNVKLLKGGLRLLGLGGTVLPDTTVTITSASADNPTWVYVQRNKATGAVTIETTDTSGGPLDSADLWCFPLYCMHLDSEGNAVLDHDWRYDVRMGTPIG